MALKEIGFKSLTEILKQLSKKGVKAQTPSVRASRRALKGERKFEPITGAGSRKPGRKIGEGVPTTGKGRATVKKTTPPIKAQRIDVQAKPKTTRTVGRKKIPMKPFTPIAGAGSRKAGPTKADFVSKPSTKKTPTRSKITPPVTPASKIKKGPLAAAIGLGGAALTGAMLNKKDKAQAATSKSSGPATRGSNKPKVAPKATPKAVQPSGPSKRGSAKRGATKTISAGPNTGFGPKGNQFPGSKEERAALMKMYGGTGSAAAKAAIAGKQGNLAAGKADYEAARIKRLSKPVERKSGGSVVARQVKGFGAARRPKK